MPTRRKTEIPPYVGLPIITMPQFGSATGITDPAAQRRFFRRIGVQIHKRGGKMPFVIRAEWDAKERLYFETQQEGQA